MDHTHTNVYRKIKDQREIFLPEVWGTHYWFFLMTIALTYPDNVNAVTKRKYYDLIQNMPIFIPNAEISKNFSEILNKYPVTPYLDNRDSFVHWIVFIHNRVNNLLDKREITMDEAMDQYFKQMVPPIIFVKDKLEYRKYGIYIASILLLAIFVYFCLFHL
jgi:hypothetical protein